MVNFQEIKDAYKIDPLGILKQLIPSGRIEGHDYVVKNPKRNDGNIGSFRIDISTCRFHDFATGDRGSGIIDLAAFIYDCDIVTAAGILRERRPLYSLASNYQEPAKKKRVDPVYIWNRSFESDNSEDHKYLTKKQISIGNARINDYKGERKLVIPLIDIDFKLRNIQFIRENGKKSFLLPFKGLFHVASDYGYSRNVIVMAEGYATARSISEVISLFVIAAMSACNMIDVALKMRELYPYSLIIIAADKDEAGEKAAEDTVQALGNHNVQIIYPTHGNDFNDDLIEIGANNLNSQIMNQIGKEIIRE